MPGIVGYVGGREAAPLVIEGLRRLEYRGYDSAGLAVQMADGSLIVRRGAGKRLALDRLAARLPLGYAAIGHSRWATHGRPSERNAHPHCDCDEAIAVVHGGIVPDFLRLRDRLQSAGHRFRSETDTEVLPHLIEERLAAGAPDLLTAVRAVLADLGGAQVLVVLATCDPGALVAACVGEEDGLVIGYGDGEMSVASDKQALLGLTRTVATLQPGELARVTAEGVTYSDLAGLPLEKHVYTIGADLATVALGGYRHFTQKEMYTQPEALTHTLRGRLDAATGGVYLDEVRYTPAQMRALTRLVIVGAGSSWYSALAGAWIFEELAGLPVTVESATEFRYRDPPLDSNTLVLAITQSGATGDTLAALALARRKGSRVLGIVNALGTPAEALADGIIGMNAGPELGLVATKSFVCSLVDQVLLALALGWARDTVPTARAQALTRALAALPDQAAALLADDAPYNAPARAYSAAPSFLYIGRGPGYAAAVQGAHLLTVMAGLPAQAVPAGEVPHGTQTLLDHTLPVVALAPAGLFAPDMRQTLEHLRAQDAPLIVLGPAGDRLLADLADHLIVVPPTDPLLEPVLLTLPLQLLAYEIAVRRGSTVDHPRFLAQTVGADAREA